jgi:hypothetical protein
VSELSLRSRGPECLSGSTLSPVTSITRDTCVCHNFLHPLDLLKDISGSGVTVAILPAIAAVSGTCSLRWFLLICATGPKTLQPACGCRPSSQLGNKLRSLPGIQVYPGSGEVILLVMRRSEMCRIDSCVCQRQVRRSPVRDKPDRASRTYNGRVRFGRGGTGS